MAEKETKTIAKETVVVEKQENNSEALIIKISELEASIAERDSKIETLGNTVDILENVVAEREREKESLEAKISELETVNKKTTSKTKKPSKDDVKVKFLLSPAGKFKLPYNVGQVVLLEKEIAAEIVEAKYAEFVK